MPFLKCKTHEARRSQIIEESSTTNGLRKKIVNPSGTAYQGEWVKNRKDGYGCMETRTKKVYEGHWQEDLREDFGVQSEKDGMNINQLEYRGQWRKGHRTGFGEMHSSDGFYRGSFKNSLRHGQGEMWYVDGTYYYGNWLYDLRHGEGLFVELNGNRYEGDWYKGLKEGRGRFYFLDKGVLMNGAWLKGVCISSELEEMPYRQSGRASTKYEFPVNELVDVGSFIERCLFSAMSLIDLRLSEDTKSSVKISLC